LAPRPAIDGPSRGALVLSAALLPLFLHADYQPSADLDGVSVRVADLAVAAVVVAAILEARRIGLGRLRAGRWAWSGITTFFAAVGISMVAAASSDRTYPLADHLVTAAKYAEYALIAVAVPLVIRQRTHARMLFATVAGISVAATVVGLLQLTGVPLLDEWPAGRRQPSFLGHHDFAALSGASLSLAFAALVLGEVSARGRVVAAIAGVSGAVGLVVSGAITGAAGLAFASTVVLVVAYRVGTLDRRRALLVVLTTAAVAVGVVGIRSSNIAELFDDETGTVETFSHRGVLAYIGLKEFAGSPAFGIGWQASLDEAGYGPYLDDARRRFPDQPARVFPSPEEPWGVQNAYLQALADMGVVGAAGIVALLAGALVTGLRTALRSRVGSAALAISLTGTLWLCVLIGVLNGIGFVAGLPLDALLWLAIGLVATAAAGMESARE
jgi:hypothetical protein